jgi:tRNA (mo5U34)-methyltransferase
MATKRFGYRGFGVALEVPDRLFRRPPSRKAKEREAMGPLEIGAPLPPLMIDHRLSDIPEILAEIAPEGHLAWEPLKEEPDLDLAELVRKIGWYHTIDLPGGIVTPGLYDQRLLVQHYDLPSRLDGQRVLDVGTWDGFWAFEFERRGAEVTAIDVATMSDYDLPTAVRKAMQERGVNPPTGAGFKLAHRALKSRVNRVECNVYELDSHGLGQFDIVHMGSVLLSLENPLEALRRLRAVTRGKAIIVDRFKRSLPRGRS